MSASDDGREPKEQADGGDERAAGAGEVSSGRLLARLRALSRNRRAVLWASVALDLLVVFAVLAIRWQAQLREVPEPALLGSAVVPSWWWSVGWIGDWTLFPGPDAGHWAVDAQKWIVGGQLDPNRAPVYTMLVALTTPLWGDLVFAGHMTNHLLSLALCLVAYALGRATSGRAPAAAAALMVAASPALVNVKGLFGVDPTQQLAILLLALLTWRAACGRWWRLIPAGLAVGLAATAHYLSFAFAVPAALMLVLCDAPAPPGDDAPRGPAWIPIYLRDPSRLPGARWLYRLMAPAVALLLGYLVWLVMMMRHPRISLWHVFDVYSEGIATYSGKTSETMMSFAQAVELVQQRLGEALGKLQLEVLDSWAQAPFTWQVLAGLGLLGILGPGLLKRPASRLGWDWRPGLWIAVFLMPLVGLAASRTPGRYYIYATPLVFLAVMRGLASLAAGVDYLLRRKLRWWPAGPLAAVVCGSTAVWFSLDFADSWDQRQALDRDLYNRRVGQMIKQRFGEGECIITRSQEILFYSGRTGTLTAPCAQYQARKLVPCLQRILAECRRSEDIPFVLEDNTHYGPGDKPNKTLQALVRENFEMVGTVEYKLYAASVYRMKRHILEAVLQQSTAQ